MKILELCDFFDNYHNESSFRIRYLTAKKMAERGHDVVFMYPEHHLNIQRQHINSKFLTIGTPGLLPTRFRTGGFALLDGIFKSIEVLRSHFDVIHVTTGHRPSQLLPCLVGKYLKGTVIVDECWEWLNRGNYVDARKGLIGRSVNLYDKCFEIRFKTLFDHVVVISTALKNRFKNKEKVSVLYGGAGNQGFQYMDIAQARQLLSLSHDSFFVGMSNVNPGNHQDHEIFYKAMTHMCDKHENIYLIATGADIRYIEETAEHCGFADKVIAPGYVDFDKYCAYLCACNIFVAPYPDTITNRGRWPNKIGDYLCAKRPIVSNPTGDIKTIFERYKVGLLCDATPDGFSQILEDVITKKTDTSAYTQDSLYVANEVLSFDERVDKLLEIFERTVNA